MGNFAGNRDYPEALVMILLTVIDRTPDGGATLDELKDAYENVRDCRPHNKTIHRAINRLNRLFDPLAYIEKGTPAIEPVRKNNKTRFRFTKDLASRPVDAGAAFLMALSLYPQQRGMLGDQFEVVMKLVFEEIFSKLATVADLQKDIEKHVYVTGAGPIEPQKSLKIIEMILQGIRLQKPVRFEYHRTYDGETTRRVVEPYGLICRFNTWYLVGRCCHKNGRRIFLLSQINAIRLVEDKTYTIPAGFSLAEEYCTSWGVWTEDDAKAAETVRLQVGRGLGEKFRTTCFHESQQVKELPDGTLDVTFSVTGAQEMLPWLLTWGPTIKLLEPDWLVEELKSQLRKTMNRYAAPV